MNKIKLIFLFLLFTTTFMAQTIWLETEQFDDKGGWVIDPQFIDQMGSPYIMAHGNGKPVKDAVTNLTIQNPGTYYIWVRTYDWNAPWNKNLAPGVFQLKINDNTVANLLGNKPDEWGWQLAGKISLQKGDKKLILHDLTGFNGRCDAVVLTTEKNIKLPDSGEALYALRRKLSNVQTIHQPNKYDLVVVGGGIGGLSAAIAASRLGLKTLLIHNRAVIGGNNSPEIAIGVLGGIKKEPYPQIGNVLSELGNIYKNYSAVDAILKKEANLTLALNQHVAKVTKKGNEITSVIAKDITTGKEYEYKGFLFSDCTGDGNLGYLAGAEYKVGRETQSEYGEDLAPEIKSNLSLGSTLKWSATKTDNKVTFPETPWAVQFTENTCQKVMGFVWYWETGFYNDQILDAEQIRDYWFRVIFGNWSYLKNKSSVQNEYSTADLNDVSFILGKRESRRLLGDYILTQQDVQGKSNKYDDGVVVATYSIDQHFPNPENSVYFPGQEFISIQKHNNNPFGKVDKTVEGENINNPYLIPYRCLYSKNISNLFMAGRNISVTRIALASTRVQGTISMMGEVVAISSLLCRDFNCLPKDIYSAHLSELKQALNKGIPVKNKQFFNPPSHL